MSCVDKELEFLLAHPFAGGSPEEGETDGDGAGEQDGGQQGQGGKGEQDRQGEVDRAAGDTGRDNRLPKDQWIPKHRFDEVNRGYTAYKGFGTPDEIKAKLARLQELESRPGTRLNEKEKAEIRQEILSVVPELSRLIPLVENQASSFTAKGEAMNAQFLKEIGLQANDETNQYMTELLAGIIASDKALLKRFHAFDTQVFSDAFAKAKKTFWPNVKRAVPGAGVQKLKETSRPANPGNPKKGEDGKEEKPLDRLGERNLLDDASERAFAMLENARD